jgi:hypothetical protein
MLGRFGMRLDEKNEETHLTRFASGGVVPVFEFRNVHRFDKEK